MHILATLSTAFRQNAEKQPDLNDADSTNSKLCLAMLIGICLWAILVLFATW